MDNVDGGCVTGGDILAVLVVTDDDHDDEHDETTITLILVLDLTTITKPPYPTPLEN